MTVDSLSMKMKPGDFEVITNIFCISREVSL